MKRLFQLFTIVILMPVSMQAQDLVDALRYSNFQVQGTARAGGMGNAFGALGADFTSVSINPAGLGLYRAGEFVFTPAFDQTQVESRYLGNLMSDKNYNFSINNISYVASIPTQKTSESGIVNVNVGLGYNRLKDFNSEILVGANGVESSFLDNLIENANGEDPNEGWSNFYENLAYYDESNNFGTDLIYEENGYWISDLQQNPFDNNVNNYTHYQRKSISKQGSVDEFSLALGLNFNHKLYLGASIGIVDVDYKESSRLIEQDRNNIIPNFNELEFDSYLRTTGTGYNGKLGIIYKPINEVRLGVSIHTPTFYNLHDVFETSMYSSNTFENVGLIENEADSPYSEYDYDIETPMRATFSSAFVIAKKGLLSIDYEVVDYGSASLRRGGDGYDFVEENSEITEAYKTVGNLRVGGEYRATDNISFRAGIEHYPSAYNDQSFETSQQNANANLNAYTAGFGYRQGNFYVDVAYRYTDYDNYDLLYSAPATSTYPTPQMAQMNTMKNKVIFSLGFKF